MGERLNHEAFKKLRERLGETAFNRLVAESEKSPYLMAIIDNFVNNHGNLEIDDNGEGVYIKENTIYFTANSLANLKDPAKMSDEDFHLTLMQIAHEIGHFRDRSRELPSVYNPETVSEHQVTSEGYAHLDEYIVATQLGARMHESRGNLQTEIDAVLNSDEDLKRAIETRSALGPDTQGEWQNFDQQTINLGISQAREREPSNMPGNGIKYPEHYLNQEILSMTIRPSCNHHRKDFCAHLLDPDQKYISIDWTKVDSNHFRYDIDSNNQNIWNLTIEDLPLQNGNTLSINAVYNQESRTITVDSVKVSNPTGEELFSSTDTITKPIRNSFENSRFNFNAGHPQDVPAHPEVSGPEKTVVPMGSIFLDKLLKSIQNPEKFDQQMDQALETETGKAMTEKMAQMLQELQEKERAKTLSPQQEQDVDGPTRSKGPGISL